MLEGLATGVERYMNLLSLRQKLVTANIANADTPNYKTKDIDFRAEFQSQLEGASPQVQELSSLPEKTDGNNVSLDREARLLAENALRFNVASNIAMAKLRAVKLAIENGGG